MTGHLPVEACLGLAPDAVDRLTRQADGPLARAAAALEAALRCPVGVDLASVRVVATTWRNQRLVRITFDSADRTRDVRLVVTERTGAVAKSSSATYTNRGPIPPAPDLHPWLRNDAPGRVATLWAGDDGALVRQCARVNAARTAVRESFIEARQALGAAVYAVRTLAADVEALDPDAPALLVTLAGDWDGTVGELLAAADRLRAGVAERS